MLLCKHTKYSAQKASLLMSGETISLLLLVFVCRKYLAYKTSITANSLFVNREFAEKYFFCRYFERNAYPMLLDRIKILLKERSMTLAELERKLNFGNGSMSRWNKSTPSGDKIQKVADYFNVSTDYLLGRTDKRHYYDLTEKDKQDIALQAEKLLEGLNSDAETNYYGEPLDDEDKEKLYDAIQLALALTKVKAKKKFTPKKYRQ